MALVNTVIGDMHVTGNITSGGGVSLGTGTVTNAAVAAGAGVSASKLEHQHIVSHGQVGNAADETIIKHIAYGAGTIVDVSAACVGVAVGSATCTVDVKKNGTTILSSPITLNSSSTTLEPQAATLSVTSYAAGDVFTFVFDGTTAGGTLPTGVGATMVLREAAAP